MILDKPIIAVDFDGTLTLGDTRQWQNGVSHNDNPKPRNEVFNLLKAHRSEIYLILWTCREGRDLDRAVDFCGVNGLVFDKVNENVVAYPTSRKILADYYLDDSALNLINLKDLELCITSAKR